MVDKERGCSSNSGLVHGPYNERRWSTDMHPYRTATSGGVPLGVGLNTLPNYPWVDFERVKRAMCSDASSNDCLAPKGFTFMRLALSGFISSSVAMFVDFYNLIPTRERRPETSQPGPPISDRWPSRSPSAASVTPC